jgi:hypothetical protein
MTLKSSIDAMSIEDALNFFLLSIVLYLVVQHEGDKYSTEHGVHGHDGVAVVSDIHASLLSLLVSDSVPRPE